MNRWQKIAWYNVIVIAVTLALTAVLVAFLAFTVGMPRARAGLGLLGFLGLLGLSPILFRAKPSEVPFDERDRLINYRAVLAAYSIFWPIITAACMIPWFIIGLSGSVPVWYLPLLLGGIGITLTLVHSVAILA
jgi:hypothetical protein